MSFYNGLSLLIFHPKEYDQEYGCQNITMNRNEKADTHPILCILQLILALVSEILYGFCMYSIWKHLQFSCYKILFYIGIIDMLGLIVGAILCSMMGLTGATFCDFPITQYLTGGLAMAFWFAETTSEFILAFNRCLELLAPEIATAIFKENRTWLLLMIPSGYALFSWLFTRPVMFSTTKFAFFFSPYEDYNRPTAEGIYSNLMHTFNNTLVSCVLCTTYGVFCLLWVGRMIKMRAIAKPAQQQIRIVTTTMENNNNNQNKNPNDNKIVRGTMNSMAVQMTFLQVVFISFFNACAAGLGVYMEHFVIFPELIVVAQLTYVLTHAAPPFVYLICNRTIRADSLALLYRMLGKQQVSSVTVLMREGGVAGVGGVTSLIVPAPTQSVGIERRGNGNEKLASPGYGIANDGSSYGNGLPLFRRQIEGSSYLGQRNGPPPVTTVSSNF